LPEAAAGVEEGVGLRGQARQDGRVEGVRAEVQVQEAELADAGVGPEVEGAVALGRVGLG